MLVVMRQIKVKNLTFQRISICSRISHKESSYFCLMAFCLNTIFLLKRGGIPCIWEVFKNCGQAMRLAGVHAGKTVETEDSERN